MTTLATYEVIESESVTYKLEKNYDKMLDYTLWVLTTVVSGREVSRDVYQRLNSDTRKFFGAWKQQQKKIRIIEDFIYEMIYSLYVDVEKDNNNAEIVDECINEIKK